MWRVTALASALGMRITALVSRPSDNKALEAQIAFVASRVALLEATSANPQLDDGGTAFVVADRRLSGDVLDGYILNVKIAGLVLKARRLRGPRARGQGRAQQDGVPRSRRT